jgi:DNA (cytosine-5)-methyltransferase 1
VLSLDLIDADPQGVIVPASTRRRQTKPLSAPRPVAVDLFAGAGGMSLGFEQAGFDVMAAVEIDPVHALVHRFNFPHCAVLPRSVVGLTGDAIRDAAGLGVRKVDVVCGGAPCQGFSLIGKRVLDDPRNALVREFMRIVCELDAPYFVFENVRGITLGEHRRVLDELVEAFEGAGYDVRSPWRVLNASEYGVPQDRERLFLLGAKRGHALPKYPSPTTTPADLLDLYANLPVGPTCRDALDDLPDADEFDTLIESDAVRTTRWGEPSGYARTMRCDTEAGWLNGYEREWDASILTSSTRTHHTEISQRRFAATQQGSVEPISRFFKLSANGIANTLRAGTDGSRGAFTSPRPIHYAHPRCVTVREMARLHGFPDWFRLHATKWHGARQIGNAVPPPLAHAVASAVAQSAGFHPSHPRKAMSLGDPRWLNVTVTEAAELLGVVAPSMRRDQRSGATKRSQAETEAERLSQPKRR